MSANLIKRNASKRTLLLTRLQKNKRGFLLVTLEFFLSSLTALGYWMVYIHARTAIIHTVLQKADTNSYPSMRRSSTLKFETMIAILAYLATRGLSIVHAQSCIRHRRVRYDMSLGTGTLSGIRMRGHGHQQTPAVSGRDVNSSSKDWMKHTT